MKELFTVEQVMYKIIIFFTSNRSKLINFNFYNYTEQIKYNNSITITVN